VSEIFDALHADYLQRLSELELLTRLRDARNVVDAANEDGNVAREDVNRVYELRRQAVDAMASVDAAFFADLRTVVPENKHPLLDRVRRSRMREIYAGSMSARFALGRDNSNEASIDVLSILLDEQPAPEVLIQLDDLLTAYEEEAEPAFRDRLQAQLDMQQMADQWAIEIQQAAREDLAAVIDLQNRYREAMQQPGDRVTQADQRIVALNRRALEQLRKMMPDDLVAAVEKAYDLAAFPSIYNDPAAVHRQLARALALNGLTADQRNQLIDVGADYRAEYQRLSRSMVDQLPASAVNVVGLAPEAFKEWQSSQQQLAKTRYDRNELNARAINRLLAILTESQVHEIGGLPEPSGEDDFFFYR